MNQTSARENLQTCASDQPDQLMKDRFHAAVNIRGIRYQALYSVPLAITPNVGGYVSVAELGGNMAGELTAVRVGSGSDIQVY
jgi:hypothetical protein